MDRLGEVSFGRMFAGLVIVGLGVDLLANYNPKAALILVVAILVSILVVNPGTTATLWERLAELRGFMLGD